MKEMKAAMIRRLEKDGRFEEMMEFKKEQAKRLMSEGMKAADAKEAAWELAADKYPPGETKATPEELKPKPPVVAPVVEKTSIARANDIPWKKLPSKAGFTEEVAWVHQQFALIVSETQRGGRMVDWTKATEKAPSYGACSLALWAADNRTAFYKDVLPKAMAAQSNSGDDAELIKEEKKSIAEVQRILEKIAGQ